MQNLKVPTLFIVISGVVLLLVSTTASARRGTEPMTPAQRFNMPDTHEDGQWSAKGNGLVDTSEAAHVLRLGDIDNFGFGWQAGATPYQGRRLRERPLYWKNPEDLQSGRGRSEDPAGTDRMYAGTRFFEKPSIYAETDPRYYYLAPEPLTFSFTPMLAEPKNMLLQLFLAGFEAPRNGSHFVAIINGEDAPFLTSALNQINLADSGGRLLTLRVPKSWYPVLNTGTFTLLIDEVAKDLQVPDAYMIDFARLLIDPKPSGRGTNLHVNVLPPSGYQPLEGVKLTLQDQEKVADEKGKSSFDYLYPGLSLLQAEHKGGSLSHVISLQENIPKKPQILRLNSLQQEL